MWNLAWEVGMFVALVYINKKDNRLVVLLAGSESTGKKDIVLEKIQYVEKDQYTQP